MMIKRFLAYGAIGVGLRAALWQLSVSSSIGDAWEQPRVASLQVVGILAIAWILASQTTRKATVIAGAGAYAVTCLLVAAGWLSLSLSAGHGLGLALIDLALPTLVMMIVATLIAPSRPLTAS